MKKRFFKTIFSVISLILLFAQSVFAVPAVTEVINTPNYTEVIISPSVPTEDIVLYAKFKDEGKSDINNEFIYTGKKVMPELIVTKFDGSVASPSEYKLTYDEDCDKNGWHFIHVDYLKNDYRVTKTYMVVPGITTKVDMTAKDGKVTLSWAAVKGASAYRVYKKNAEGRMVETVLPNGEYADPALSRTFTDLEPGKTYEMGIMALDNIHSMPTDQMKTFKVAVPKNGEGSANLVPGISQTTKKTTVPSTVKTTVQKTTETTTAKEPTATSAVEDTTVIITATEPSAIVITNAKKETERATEAIAESLETDKENSDADKTTILLGIVAAVVIVTLIVVSVIIKKKK